MLRHRQVRAEWVILGLILLLALGLRCYRLDGQSLWADEGNSAALALRSLSTITRDAAHDIHPPLYYYLLHFWLRLFGNSETALRSLSVLAGTALVLATYLLGRELFARPVALVAAFLASISPFQIYYSQETRMYILVSLWAALAILFFVKLAKAVDARSRTVLLLSLYVCFATAALYTHYFAFTVPLVTNLSYAVAMVFYPHFRRVRNLTAWVVAQLAIVVLYLPWLRLAGGQLTTWPAVSESFSLSFLIQDLLRFFSLGLSVEPRTTPAVLAFGALLLLGALPFVLWRGGRKWLRPLPRPRLAALGFTLLYLCLPVITMYILSLSRPAYDPKFLLLATPAFHLLLARGIGAEWLMGQAEGRSLIALRWIVTSLLLVLVIGASVPSLRNYFFDSRYARDDYRGIASYVSAAGREGDAIILNAPGQMDIFSYYYQGPLPVYPLPGQRPLDEGKTEETLERIVAEHRHLYILFWGTEESDPSRFIEGWLDQRTFKAMDSWFGNVRLAVYAVPEAETSSEIQHPLDLVLGEDILLLGYSIANPEVAAGDILQLTLFWQASNPIERRYKVFTHILDGRFHIVGQRDAEPVGGMRPTATWHEGEILADNYGVLVLPGTPPGEYQLEIGMYDLESGERLPVLEDGEVVGDHVLLEPIAVLQPPAPPPIEALGIQVTREVDFGPVRLLGYNLTKLGYEHSPEEPVSPGDTVHLTLFWQATDEIDRDFTLTLELQDQAGSVVLSREVKPTGGEYPPTDWEAGEIIRDQHTLLLPGELPPTRYDLSLQIHGLPTEPGRLLLTGLQL